MDNGRKFILVILGTILFISVALFFGSGERILTVTQSPSPTPQSFRTPEEVLTLEMQPQTDNGQAGTAVLKTFTGNKTKVDVMVNIATTSAQPTYIHTGKCDQLGEQAAVLVYATNGKSETIIENSLKSLLDSPHAVVIHQSITQYKNISSCANIVK